MRLAPTTFSLLLAAVSSACAARPGALPGPALAPLRARPGDLHRPWLEDPLRSFEFSVGAQSFDDEAYGSLDSTTVFGLGITEDYGLAPLFLEGALHYGFDRDRRRLPAGESMTAELARGEMSVGVRLETSIARTLRPYVGAGAALIFIDADFNKEDESSSDTDTAFGFYWKAGLGLHLTDATTVGFELRGVEGGSVSTEAFDADVDSIQVMLVFGVAR